MQETSEIEKTQIRNLLEKRWLTHDAMWFLQAFSHVGIDKANEMNRAALKFLAPIDMERVKQVLGVNEEKLLDFDHLVQFMNAALELTLPDSVMKRLDVTAPADNCIHWKWEKYQCFAYKGIKQIGAIDGYNCGVIYRFLCWLEALGFSCSTRPAIEKCLMHENGECEGDIHILSCPGRQQ
jgi:hypothetical protein